MSWYPLHWTPPTTSAWLAMSAEQCLLPNGFFRTRLYMPRRSTYFRTLASSSGTISSLNEVSTGSSGSAKNKKAVRYLGVYLHTSLYVCKRCMNAAYLCATSRKAFEEESSYDNSPPGIGQRPYGAPVFISFSMVSCLCVSYSLLKNFSFLGRGQFREIVDNYVIGSFAEWWCVMWDSYYTRTELRVILQ